MTQGWEGGKPPRWAEKDLGQNPGAADTFRQGKQRGVTVTVITTVERVVGAHPSSQQALCTHMV